MANIYKSKFTGEQIDNSVELTMSNTATNGQVLTANGTGRATWQDPSGTKVVANPSLSGMEPDLKGLEVAGRKYKVPSGGGTEVVANPVLAGTETDLTGLEVAGTKYKVPSGGGTEVVANPTGEAKEELTKLQVGSAIYSIPTGGGTQFYMHTVFINGGTAVIYLIDTNESKYTGLTVDFKSSLAKNLKYIDLLPTTSADTYSLPLFAELKMTEVPRPSYILTTYYLKNKQFVSFNISSIDGDTVTPL